MLQIVNLFLDSNLKFLKIDHNYLYIENKYIVRYLTK